MPVDRLGDPLANEAKGWYITELDCIYYPTLKCGHGAIQHALDVRYTRHGMHRATDEEVERCPTISMWREPRRRFESAYRWLKTKSIGIVDPDKPFEEWAVEALMRDDWPYNRHFKPHGCFEPPGGCVVRVWWDFAKMGELLGLSKIVCMNRVEPEEYLWTPELDQLFETRYAEDCEIWLRGSRDGLESMVR